MKALSLSQPWASAVAQDVKSIETRSWATNYRGEIAIHASAKMTKAQREFHEEGLDSLLGMTTALLPRGAIIAVATIYDCVPTTSVVARLGRPQEVLTIDNPPHANFAFRQEADAGSIERALGDFSPGRFAWLLHKIVELDTPIPCKGMLQLWTVPTVIEAEVRSQLALVGLRQHPEVKVRG